MNTTGSQWKLAPRGAKFSFLAAWVVRCMAHGMGATHFGLCGHLFLKNLKIINFCVTN